ncbi:DUF2793 domain-containing protein [Parerythrobacter aurantius]|uniref:DUF2793 domain-containing protein n=1 Tax=Parerythrobacter aurantius TaxID=3127706 RepID=UPI00324B2D64
MSEPIRYTSLSARHSLPFLFPAQAQKEAVINEALARLDALAHPAVEGSATSPPEAPGEGECWLVADGASGPWLGRDNAIATFGGGSWHFIAPCPGMTCWSVAQRQSLRYDDAWLVAAPIAPPDGGATIDTESRVVIAAILNALTMAGIFPPS